MASNFIGTKGPFRTQGGPIKLARSLLVNFGLLRIDRSTLPGTQLAKISFDQIIDLTTDVLFSFI